MIYKDWKLCWELVGDSDGFVTTEYSVVHPLFGMVSLPHSRFGFTAETPHVCYLIDREFPQGNWKDSELSQKILDENYSVDTQFLIDDD